MTWRIKSCSVLTCAILGIMGFLLTCGAAPVRIQLPWGQPDSAVRTQEWNGGVKYPHSGWTLEWGVLCMHRLVLAAWCSAALGCTLAIQLFSSHLDAASAWTYPEPTLWAWDFSWMVFCSSCLSSTSQGSASKVICRLSCAVWQWVYHDYFSEEVLMGAFILFWEGTVSNEDGISTIYSI